jgi:hypothetical protein
MSNLLAPVADKLSKLIPRLATDHDGEIVATVRAIRRTLKSAGLDFHALSGALSAEPKVVVLYREPPQSEPDPGNWREIARWCRDNDGGRLSSSERKFVVDMANRLVLNGKPTERQANWLRAIYAKLHEEFVP